MAESIQNALKEELSKVCTKPFLDIGEARQAAMKAYGWLLESIPRGEQTRTANLFDMLSYLLDQSERFGFNFDTRIEHGRLIVVITSNDKENKILPILLELLLAQIFEDMGKFGSEITHTNIETIAKITLV